MREVGLGGLGVVVAPVAHGPAGGADGEPACVWMLDGCECVYWGLMMGLVSVHLERGGCSHPSSHPLFPPTRRRTAVELVARAVAELGSLVHQLSCVVWNAVNEEGGSID